MLNNRVEFPETNNLLLVRTLCMAYFYLLTNKRENTIANNKVRKGKSILFTFEHISLNDREFKGTCITIKNNASFHQNIYCY